MAICLPIPLEAPTTMATCFGGIMSCNRDLGMFDGSARCSSFGRPFSRLCRNGTNRTSRTIVWGHERLGQVCLGDIGRVKVTAQGLTKLLTNLISWHRQHCGNFVLHLNISLVMANKLSSLVHFHELMIVSSLWEARLMRF